MSNELFPIEKKIHTELNAKAEDLYRKGARDPEWTAEFKKVLVNLGHAHHYEVWAVPVENETDAGEWLWDVTWVRQRGEWEKDKQKGEGKWWEAFDGVSLACEMEWNPNPGHLMADFLKLTVAVADRRLFVCTLHPGKGEDTLEELKAVCPGSRGARYLAIGVPIEDPGQALPYRAWSL